MGTGVDRAGSNLHNFLPQIAEWLNFHQVIFEHCGFNPSRFNRTLTLKAPRSCSI
jgi:hypothetical protein